MQSVIRTIHPQTTLTPITIIERPGLNNSTGQRLWDCAIALSSYLSLHPTSLHPSPPSSDQKTKKKAKLDPLTPPAALTCLELGAGCALTSLVAATLLPPSSASSTIIPSDVEVTFSTTLKENLDANPSHRALIHPAVLSWGPLPPAEVLDILSVDGLSRDADRALTILGSDILYNPESHRVLLDTLLAFMRHPRIRTAQALIAYKPRTEGDGEFFPLAEKESFEVEKVWEWGELGVYRLTLALRDEAT